MYMYVYLSICRVNLLVLAPSIPVKYRSEPLTAFTILAARELISLPGRDSIMRTPVLSSTGASL